MADTNFKPKKTITKTQSAVFEKISEKRENAHKNNGQALSRKTETKALRRMTVSYDSIRHYAHKTNRTKRYPRSASLRLNGTWMEEARFTTGTKIDVLMMPISLVITTRPTVTPLMQVLNKTTELPESEQQQIIVFFLRGVMTRATLGER